MLTACGHVTAFAHSETKPELAAAVLPAATEQCA